MTLAAATITFSATAQILEPEETPTEIVRAIFRGMAGSCLIEVMPINDFVTYGIGIPLLKMRDPKQARGRVPVATEVREMAGLG